ARGTLPPTRTPRHRTTLPLPAALPLPPGGGRGPRAGPPPPPIAEGCAERERTARDRRLGGGRAHHRRRVRNRRRGRRRPARRSVRIGDGERHGVAAIVGVRVARAHPRTAAPVTEAPRIAQRVAVGIGRPTAVEAHSRAL